MAVTETFTAELNSRYYNNPDEGTRQGVATHGTWDGLSWVGMVLLPISLKGKRITAIKLTMTANTAGTTSEKTVSFYSSNHQSASAEGKGSIFPKEFLGSAHAAFRNTTTVVKLSDSFLTEVAEYFSNGNQMLILYDPSSTVDNYCRFTNITFEITYGEKGTVGFKRDGMWEECEVYYMRNGVYERVIPHIMVDGTYEECSSS